MHWWILAAPSAVYFFSYVHRVAPSVVAEDLMRAFSVTASALGNLAAVYPYVFVVMALVAGSLADTLGPRWTLALGSSIMGVGAIVFGAAPSFAIAYIGRLLVGLGASVILIASLRLATEWFRPAQFAMVSGWMQMVGNVGSLAASAPLAALVQVLGWRGSFVTIGLTTLALAGVAVALVRDRPQALGLPAVNPGAASSSSLREVLAGIPAVTRNVQTWPPLLAGGTMHASFLAFLGLWAIPYLTQVYGIDRLAAAGTTSMLALGIIAGAPFVGWLSDRWLGARRAPLLAFSAAYALCWALLALPGGLRLPLPWVRPVFFVMGFASAGFVLIWACVREVNDPRRVGIAIAFCNVPTFLTFALLQWAMGLVLDVHWDGVTMAGRPIYPAAAFHAAFTVCLGTAVFAFFMACFVAETRCRNVWRPAAA